MLTITNLSKSYPKNRGLLVNNVVHNIVNNIVNKFINNPVDNSLNNTTQALSSVSFHLDTGQCLGVVGESGSGKSTLARLILGLEKPDSGSIDLYTSQISAVFQDYVSSVNPSMQAHEIILEPLIINKYVLIKQSNAKFSKDTQSELVNKLLDKVGLPRKVYFKYPHELSSGQLQRLCIARSLSIYPKFILLDEPTSSLDMINQLKILDLLKTLQQEFELTYLFISHDIQAVTYLCDELIFLHQGKVIEQIKTMNLAQVKSKPAQKLLLSLI